MKTLSKIFLCAFLILIIKVNSLNSQTSHYSQSSHSYQSTNFSQLNETKTKNSSSSQNSDKQDKDLKRKSSNQDSVPQKVNKISKTIELSGETIKKQILIAVSEKDSQLTIDISTIITDGGLKVEIYDPSGEKLDNCSVDCKDSKGKEDKLNEPSKIESASCSLSKSFNPPMRGEWKIIIKSEKAKGTLKIEVN